MCQYILCVIAFSSQIRIIYYYFYNLIYYQLSTDNQSFTGYIPIEELEITYSTSSGPGGQNVNKLHTKVDLRFKLESAKWLKDEVRQKLIDMVNCQKNV